MGSSPNDTDILTQLHNMKIILLTSQVLLVGVCASDQQGNNFVNTEKCSEQRESLDKVFRVLDGLSDVTQMLSEIRKLERKVNRMSKTLKNLGFDDNEEDEEDEDGEIVKRRVPSTPASTTSSTTSTTTKTTTVTTITESGPCNLGWSNIGDGCYLVVTDQALSWEEARQQCLLQGTDLAEMNTIEEQRHMTRFLNNWHYGIPFWLGGQKNARGKWRWEWTETRVPTRAVKWGWAQDYPRDLSANNTCLAIRGRGEIGALKTWEDANCYDNNHFICEYLWLQEYMEEDMNKISGKLQENLVLVDKLKRSRSLENS